MSAIRLPKERCKICINCRCRFKIWSVFFIFYIVYVFNLFYYLVHGILRIPNYQYNICIDFWFPLHCWVVRQQQQQRHRNRQTAATKFSSLFDVSLSLDVCQSLFTLGLFSSANNVSVLRLVNDSVFRVYWISFQYRSQSERTKRNMCICIYKT